MERIYDIAVVKEAQLPTQPITSCLQSVMFLNCELCEGTGHTVKECASKKKLDRIFNCLGFKSEWGQIKSLVVEDNVNISLETRQQINEIRELQIANVHQPVHAERVRIQARRLDAINNLLGRQNQNQQQGQNVQPQQANPQPQGPNVQPAPNVQQGNQQPGNQNPAPQIAPNNPVGQGNQRPRSPVQPVQRIREDRNPTPRPRRNSQGRYLTPNP